MVFDIAVSLATYTGSELVQEVALAFCLQFDY